MGRAAATSRSARPIPGPWAPGYEEDESDFLAGMAERRGTFEVGLAAAWDLGVLDLEATLAADALGRSEGAQASLDLTWSKIFGRGTGGLFPAIGVVWQDADCVDYYGLIALAYEF